MQIKKSAVIAVAILLLLPLASAGFFDFITGRLASQPQDLNVPVGNTGPKVVFVSGTSANPTEASTTAVAFSVLVYDHDLVADLNDTGVHANFTKASEATREVDCTLVGDIDANTANYSCTIAMWYWDAAGSWNVGVKAKDLSNTYAYNITQTFTYGSLPAIVISPANITWSEITPGALNLTSNNDPTTINNTGNYVVTSGNIQMNATDLIGESVASKKIVASYFDMGTTTGAGDPECEATTMVGGEFTGITGSALPKGNLSAGSGTAQEELYYCLTEAVSTLIKQSYSTPSNSKWTIKIV